MLNSLKYLFLKVNYLFSTISSTFFKSLIKYF